MVKRILIEVRDEFVVPNIFSDDDTHDVSLREAALTIGSRAVQESIGNLKETEKQRKIIDIERQANIDCMKSMKEKLQQQIYSENEARIKHEIREALLQEKERHAAEKEALASKLEDRHTAMIVRSEMQHNETRRTLDQLREEHEGLVLKLMARLEPVSASRGGTGSSTSAAALGRTFEENVQKHLRQIFGVRPDFQLEDTHATGHSGDLIMTYDGLRILIELKSYDPKTRVPSKEVEKLARDLTDVQPPCNGAIMISACSEITGHYSCGPLEVSAEVASVPVLFINNFLSIGEPQITLHMSRVFLTMVQVVLSSVKRVTTSKSLTGSSDDDENGVSNKLEKINVECSRRCTGYLVDLNKQSAELLRQVTTMKTGATKLRDTVVSLVENEVTRFTSIIQLMGSSHTPTDSTPLVIEASPPQLKIEAPPADAPVTTPAAPDTAVVSPPSVGDATGNKIFISQVDMTQAQKDLAAYLNTVYVIGDLEKKCPTKELLECIRDFLKVKSAHIAREALKNIFLDVVVKHGHVLGLEKKVSLPSKDSSPQISPIKDP